jgi:hypothetical protein
VLCVDWDVKFGPVCEELEVAVNPSLIGFRTYSAVAPERAAAGDANREFAAFERLVDVFDQEQVRNA